MGIDEISRILGNLERGQADQQKYFSEFREEMRNQFADLKTNGCAKGAEQDKRITELESKPNQQAGAVAAGISVAVGAIVEAFRRWVG